MGRVFWAAILAGGEGRRLWPLSDAARPKQFREVAGDTLLGHALKRMLAAPAGLAGLSVIGSERHAALLAAETARHAIAPDALLLEPVGRNTAAAVATAACAALAHDPDAMMLVAPCDQLIPDTGAFWRAVEQAGESAETCAAVILGIRADRPDTRFGYIRLGAEAREGAGPVAAFHEKPDRETARAYVAAGCYWNCGVFVMRAERARALMMRHCPQIWIAAEQAWAGRRETALGVVLDATAYEEIEAQPFDRAVLERAGGIVMVEAGFDWHDLGDWQALLAAMALDEGGNFLTGDARVEGGRDCLVETDGPQVVLSGVSGLAVVVRDGQVRIGPTIAAAKDD